LYASASLALRLGNTFQSAPSVFRPKPIPVLSIQVRTKAGQDKRGQSDPRQTHYCPVKCEGESLKAMNDAGFQATKGGVDLNGKMEFRAEFAQRLIAQARKLCAGDSFGIEPENTAANSGADETVHAG